MLKRQNLPPAEQAAAVIDEMIVERFEHIESARHKNTTKIAIFANCNKD